MSVLPILPDRDHDLVEIPNPFIEPRIAHQISEPRKVNNLTLIDGKTFLSTTVSGDITPSGAPDVGFFHDDTRFLSSLELKVGGQRAVVLSSSTEKSFASQIELTTGNIALRDSFDLPENTLHIRREQLLSGNVFFDYLTVANFNLTAVDVTVELTFKADFVDVFQVRGVARKQSGQYYRPVVNGDSIAFVYRGLDHIVRETLVKLVPRPHEIRQTTAVWNISLKPMERIRLEATMQEFFERDEHFTGHGTDFGACLRNRRHAFDAWQQHSTSFRSSDDRFNAALKTAAGDFHALQIPNGREHIIAAGIPWFATVFGRDSIIAAYQSLMLNPRLAADTLRVLARYQGKEVNDWRDEEPGKILHEHRDGEMTQSGEMPFGAYYGSVDATPLFLVLASEVFNWTADEKLIHDLLPSIYAALKWIDSYGEFDGDGLVKYRRRSQRGL